MNERELRDALQSGAGSAVATPEKWEAVVGAARVVRRRRVAQRFAVAGLSAAALIVAGVVLWMSGPSEDRRDLIDQPSGAGPAYIVVAEDGGVVVRDARDGHLLRLIVETGQQVQDVSVSPDGSEVYYTKVSEGPCPSGGESVTRLQVAKVAITGGEHEVVVEDGHQPSLSPMGNQLAYVSGPCTAGPGELIVRTNGDPATDRSIGGASPEEPGVPFPVGWSPDETVLLTEGSPPVSRQRELFTIEGLPADHRKASVYYPDDDGLEGPAVILGPRSLAGSVELDGQTWIASFDPKTGEITERLFELPTRPEYLHVDASGQHFLAGVDAERGYTVYRWSVGDEAPTKLEDVMVRDLSWARGPTKAPRALPRRSWHPFLRVVEQHTGTDAALS